MPWSHRDKYSNRFSICYLHLISSEFCLKKIHFYMHYRKNGFPCFRDLCECNSPWRTQSWRMCFSSQMTLQLLSQPTMERWATTETANETYWLNHAHAHASFVYSAFVTGNCVILAATPWWTLMACFEQCQWAHAYCYCSW